MNTAQQHAQEILPLVTAQANGEVIQMYVGGEWSDCKEPTAFVNGCKFRVKPKTIFVNGFEVPEPMRVKLEFHTMYFTPQPVAEDMFFSAWWTDHRIDSIRINRGICHTTKEAAIAHAKAMLGIDPKDGE